MQQPASATLHEASEKFRAGDIDAAEALLRPIVAASPDDVPALHLLGCVAIHRSDIDTAEKLLRRAAESRPPKAEYVSDLGVALVRLGRRVEALQCFESAFRLNPQVPLYARNAAEIYQRHWNPAAAAEWMERAARVTPDQPEILAQLGGMYRDLGRTTESIACLSRAMAMRPDDLGLRLRLAIARLSVCYENIEDTSRSRELYAKDLEGLERRLDAARHEQLAAAAPSVGSMTTFYLPYQGENDFELQGRYGRIATRFLHARYPQYALRPGLPKTKRGTPLRIGILSAWLFDTHSNWKMPIRGWVENLDRARYQLYAYYVGLREHAGAQKVAQQFEGRYLDCGDMEVEEIARRVRADDLHMLIYPEIGMWPAVTVLAALRLASIQCSSWGHPETSGLPTIDYFLSSELMEPENGEHRYSETLVQLPNLSISYSPPQVGQVERQRAHFGLQDNAVCYFCAQSLFKYLPRHDFVFVEIARRVPAVQFVFLGDFFSPEQSLRVKRRIERALAAGGIDPSGKVVMMSTRLAVEEFHALARLCDVYLDSLDWSGCNSAMEAMQNGLPLATFPGRYMRGRHTYAFLKVMGLTDLIAESEAQYLDLVVKLGTDSAYRDHVKRNIAMTLPRLYGDLDCVRGLERFIDKAVAGRRKEEAAAKRNALPDAEAPLVEHLPALIHRSLADRIPKDRPVALIDIPETADCSASAVWHGELSFLRALGIEPAYQCSAGTYAHELLREALGTQGMILFHGGGSFGDARPSFTFCERVLADFPRHDALFFPQAVAFSGSEALLRFSKVCQRRKRLALCASDQVSFETLQDHFKGCETLLAPDMAFSPGRQTRMLQPTADILILSRTDSESTHDRGNAIRQNHGTAVDEATLRVDGVPISGQMPMHRGDGLFVADWSAVRPTDESSDAYAQLQTADKAALHFAWGKLLVSMAHVVITDRVHGHILCVMLGIPHILIPDRSGRLKQFANTWATGSPLVRSVDSLDEAIKLARVWATDLRSPADPKPDINAAIDAVLRTRLSPLSREELAAIADTCTAVERAGTQGILIEVGCESESSALVIASAKSRARRFRAFAQIYGDQEALGRTRENLARLDVITATDAVEIVAGLSQETLRVREPVAFAHIGNHHPEMLSLCLERIIPMLSPGGTAILDGRSSREQELIIEFFRGLEEAYLLELLPSGQLRIIRRSD